MAGRKSLDPAKIAKQAARDSQNTNRRYGQSLALAARAQVPADLLVTAVKAILMGYNPELVPDDRFEGGYRIDDRSELGTPNLEDKKWALQFLRLAAFGQPVQEVLVDQRLRAELTTQGAGIDERKIDNMSLPLTVAVMNLLRQHKAGTLQEPVSQDVIDVSPGPQDENLSMSNNPQAFPTEIATQTEPKPSPSGAEVEQEQALNDD